MEESGLNSSRLITERQMSPPPDPDRTNYMNQIDQVRMKFNDLDVLTGHLQNLSERLISCTTTKEFKQIHTEFEAHIQKASQLIKTIKAQIDALDISNKDFEARYEEGARESELNFRKISWAGFANRLRSSLQNFNRAQTRFETVYGERTGANGLNPDLTESSYFDQELETSLLQKAFAATHAEEDNIKKEDMKRLERSLIEIREAFLQIAALVDSQGEMLDCIEFSVVNAKNYNHQANIQLIQARKKQRTRMWCQLCCAIFILLILVGVGIGIWQLVKSLNKE